MSFYLLELGVSSMRNNVQKINHIFLKKMILSSIAQIVVLGLLIIFVRNYMNHSQLNTMADDLLVKDEYTIDQIGSYQILGNKYALDLELHNLGDMRKLDSIKFVNDVKEENKLYDCTVLNDKNFQLCKVNNGYYFGISAVKSGKDTLGYILASKKYHPAFFVPVAYDLFLIILTVLGTFIFNFMFLFLSIKKKIESNTELLINFISVEKDVDKSLSKIDIDEYKILAEKFIEEKSEIALLQKDKMYYEAKKFIAEQVAHDIRSPLAAINTAVSDVSSIPENRRIMIRNASKRINDIANNLLLQSKNTLLEENNVGNEADISPELVFVVLDNIVAEKRYEYYKSKFDIQLNTSNCSYSCFAKVNLASFKRVLSNLINNSIEAINFSGLVTLYLRCNDKNVFISIEDNGCGIPQEVLPKVTQQGFSFGKKNGAGFGLSYAKKYVEQLSGEISIHSEINVGTKVTINLPRSNYPGWFCKSLNIQPTSVIVVLDDDPSIHDAWNEKLGHLSEVTIIHFSKALDLTPNKICELDATLYLVDYELLADNKNGLDVIENLKLNNKAILVTSCFEDVMVRNRCEKANVKIIPKSYVPYIPITIGENTPLTRKLVFIDNDEMMRTAWAFAAEEAGINISIYPSPSEFANEISLYPTDTIIYIDADLGNNIKGELYAKDLYAQGFTEIYLATAHQPDYFGNMPWIKSVVGKEPPFLSRESAI